MRKASTFTIKDLATLRTLCNHPMRNEIVEIIALEPLTISEIARRVKEPANRVYYHVTELERARLVRAVRTRSRGNLLEKLYQTVAPYLRVDERIFRHGAEGLELFHQSIQTVLDTASLDLRKLSHEGRLKNRDLEAAIRSFNVLRLAPRDVKKLGQRLRALLDEFKSLEQPTGAARAALTVVFYPYPEEST